MNKRIFLSCTPAVLLAGCTAAEVQATLVNAKDAALAEVVKVVADPTLVATPAGVAVVVGSILVGFFSKQSASLAKWSGSASAGLLVKALDKLRGK